jgi:hypothetical protein
MEPTHTNIKPAGKPSLLNRMATKLPSFTAPAGPAAPTLDETRMKRADEVAKSSPALAEPSADTTPVGTPSTSSPATTHLDQYDPTRKAAAPPVKPAQPAPTHVTVPVATLQAMHDAYVAHADLLRSLMPATDTEADIAARTAARLKAQGA